MLAYKDSAEVPVIDHLFDHLNNDFKIAGSPFKLNHCIATCYRDEEDNIGFHSDKIRDIRPGTPIISLSFGEKREFHIRRKSDGTVQPLILEDGDLFVLGALTNELFEHSVVPVADEKLIKRHEPVKPRISLVFRDISTTLTMETVREKVAKTVAKREAKRQEKAKMDTKLQPASKKTKVSKN